MKLSAILALTLLATGCAARREMKLNPAVVFRFNLEKCPKQGNVLECSCLKYHNVLDAKSGKNVRVCD